MINIQKHLLLISMIISISGCGHEQGIIADINRMDFQEGNRVLKDHFSSRFPIGSDGSLLETYVKEIGLDLEVADARVGSAVKFYRATSNYRGYCKVYSTVIWREDDKRRITEILTVQGDNGCL